MPAVLFVGGWGRSGSTLLSLMAHHPPEVIAVGEVRELWLRGCLENRLCGCGAEFSDCPFWTQVGKAAFAGWERVDARRAAYLRDRLDRPWMAPVLASPQLASRQVATEIGEYAELLHRLYRGIKEVAGASMVIDSSKLATHAMLLSHAGVPTRVLHLVRDSRGVVHSWKKQVRRPDSRDSDLMLRYGVVGGSLRYLLYNALAETLNRSMDYRRLRYEDFVANPTSALNWILQSEARDAGEAAHAELAPPTQHTVDGNPIRLAARPIRIEVDEAWRRSMPREEQLLVLLLTSPLLGRYGYLRRPSRQPVGDR